MAFVYVKKLQQSLCYSLSWKRGFIFVYLYFFLAGSGAVKLTPILPGSDFVDASEVRNLIQSKGYFKGCSNTWNGTIDGIMQNEIAVCALGGLIGHLSRLMVRLLARPYFTLSLDL